MNAADTRNATFNDGLQMLLSRNAASTGSDTGTKPVLKVYEDGLGVGLGALIDPQCSLKQSSGSEEASEASLTLDVVNREGPLFRFVLDPTSKSLLVGALLGVDFEQKLIAGAAETSPCEYALLRLAVVRLVEEAGLTALAGVPAHVEVVTVEPDAPESDHDFSMQRFEVSVGGTTGTIRFGVATRLADATNAGPRRRSKTRLTASERDIPLTLDVVLNARQTSLAEVENWKTGTFIQLASDDLFRSEARVGDQAIFAGRLGRSKSDFCFQIDEILAEASPERDLDDARAA